MASIQEQLAAAREEVEDKPIKLALPNYTDGALVAVYRAPDWGAARDYVRATVEGAPSTVELDAIADGLIAASTGTEAHIDGEVHDLGHRLGRDLTEYLGITGAENDRQAVYLLVPDDIDLVTHWNELMAIARSRRERAEERVSGESLAS